MTDLEYMDRAEALLRRLEACCDRLNDETDADLDPQRVGGMVTIPPTRWLSRSASVSSLSRSQQDSSRRSSASARSMYSRSVITIRRCLRGSKRF